MSGYNEFDYAKEAIHLGVAEYLLKPVSSVKLLEALGNIRGEVEREKEEQVLKEQYQKDNQENVEHEKMKLFTSLAAGNISMGDAVEWAKELGMDLSARVYNVMLFKVSVKIDDYATPKQAMQAYAEVEEAQNVVHGVHCFRKGVEGWAFLVMGESRSHTQESIQELKQYLTETMEKYPDVEYFGGIGSPVCRIREMGDSYEEAGRVFATRFVNDSRQILTSSDIKLLHEKETLDVQNLDVMERNRTLMEKFLKKGTLEEVESFVAAYFEEMPKENLQSSLMRQYITMDMYIVASSFCGKLGIPSSERAEEARNLERALQRVTTAAGVKKYVGDLLKDTIERRDTVSGSRYLDVIKTAKAYIEANYMSEDVSLNTAAAAVNMSPSYFSSVFGREVGRTFVEYLTDVRMDKAKELLMCSALKCKSLFYLLLFF